MFSVNHDTMAISLHKGDTGAFTVTMSLQNGDAFVDGDTAIFEVWKGSTRMMHREFNLQPDEPTYTEYGDGKFLLAFRNSDTDTWEAGSYSTEIRVSLNPIRSGGKVVDGDTVRTKIQSTLTILGVLIDI